MQIPSFADQGDDRCVGAQEDFEAHILRCFRTGFAGGAEGRDFGVLEIEFLYLFEKVRIAAIRSGIAAFDVVYSQFFELLRNAELVLQGKRDILRLTPIPQCRVVDQNIFHTFPCLPMNASCSTRTASSVYLAAMTTEILISEVEIISMLTP